MKITARVVEFDERSSITPVMDEVMQRAYRAPSFARQLHWYGTVQPDGLVVAECDGVIVGTGCGMAYADAGFGWIGVVATEPGFERNGIGRLVTERVADVLAAYGCAPVLDASRAGGPLYERMNFIDHGPTRVMSIDATVDGPHPLAPLTDTVRVNGLGPITNHDLADVAAFDGIVFGADRRSLLSILVDSFVGRTAVSRAQDGTVNGFVIAQHGVIGPVAATDADTLTRLLSFAVSLSWNRPPQICVPPESAHLATLVRVGWRTKRELRHMRTGIDTLPGRTDLYAGRISLGIG